MELTPELIQAIIQTAGTPGLVAIVVWKMWNGSTKRITAIETCVNRIDRRLLKLELYHDIEDDERGA